MYGKRICHEMYTTEILLFIFPEGNSHDWNLANLIVDHMRLAILLDANLCSIWTLRCKWLKQKLVTWKLLF